MSSSSRFIDDECGVASQEMEDDHEVEEPSFITEKNLEGLTGDELREATMHLIYQEMNHIMPPACMGAKLYILHLACMYVTICSEDSWGTSLEEFITDFEVNRKVFFTELPRELVENLMNLAFAKKGTGRVGDDEWKRVWFNTIKHQGHQ